MDLKGINDSWLAKVDRLILSHISLIGCGVYLGYPIIDSSWVGCLMTDADNVGKKGEMLGTIKGCRLCVSAEVDLDN